MKKIKIIKIEVGEAPSNFYYPYLERVIHKPLRLSFIESAEVNPDLEETFTREILPIQRYAHGKHWEEYYIRDEDKKKFEDLIRVYVNNSRLDLLKEIKKFLSTKQGKDIYEFLQLLIDIENMKEEVRMQNEVDEEKVKTS